MAKALLLVPSCRDPDPVRAISTVRWGWGWGIVEAPPPPFLSHTLSLNPSSIPFYLWTGFSYVLQAGLECSHFPASASQVLMLQACTTMSVSVKAFLKEQL